MAGLPRDYPRGPQADYRDQKNVHEPPRCAPSANVVLGQTAQKTTPPVRTAGRMSRRHWCRGQHVAIRAGTGNYVRGLSGGIFWMNSGRKGFPEELSSEIVANAVGPESLFFQ